MKKSNLGLLFLAMLFVIPGLVFADSEEEFTPVAETTKYYKTVTVYRNDNLNVMSVNSNPTTTSYTTEVTQEEYDAVEGTEAMMISDYSTTIETTYKKMTSTILQNGSYYRYKNVLNWKLMPSTRAYDIIGIGFLQSVRPVNYIYFTEEWTYPSGGGANTSTGIRQTFSNGVGVSFALPSDTINSLKATLYFDVEKNTSSTIVEQAAFADYAHETTYGLSAMEAIQYSVIQNAGIVLNSAISSYYDSIQEAEAYWTGSW